MPLPSVRVYSTTHCAYCVRAKRLLEARGIPFTEIDVTNDPEARAWLVAATGQRTVPQIFFDDRAIGGSDELTALDRSGELRTLFAQTG
jgi:glutaredoxin 3